MQPFIAFVAAASSLLAAISAVSGLPHPYVCTKNFVGSTSQLRAAQSAAIKDFADLFLVQKDVITAFDRYIPDEYINHNPFSVTGRQPALDFLVPALANPDFTDTNMHAFAGEGYGIIHHRLRNGNLSFAYMDKYRFVGTCIVEHWDVGQEITGTEANPIAFF